MRGEERNPRRPRLSSPPAAVVDNSLAAVTHSRSPPLTILAAASAEKKTLKSITIDPLRRKQYTILNKYLFKYKNIFVEIDKVIIDKHPVT